jgi:flagellar hook-basal body complex protein FliE
MSNLAIDQVLAQIRALSAQAGQGVKPANPSALSPAGALGAKGVSGPSFGELLKQGVDAVNSSQQSANALADAWERGTPGVDLARVMIETQKATVGFRALTETRNRLVSAYQEIMNMPL